MRLWTLHPRYLDPPGLVGLWREALLAQAVLSGRTRGYLNHPQLIRFRQASSPLAAIRRYLLAVQAEGGSRGYRFDAGRIVGDAETENWNLMLTTTRGQLQYEWEHLREKLRRRDPSWLAGLEEVSTPDPHPLFQVIEGPVESWEAGRQS